MSVTTLITDDDVGRGPGQGALLPLGLSPDDVNCPICVETITDPFVTSCGHTFCYQCISMQLKHKNSCPSCGDYLTADNIYPNFLLNKILRKAATAPPTGRCTLLDQVQRLLADNMAPSDPLAAGAGALHHPALALHGARGGAAAALLPRGGAAWPLGSASATAAGGCGSGGGSRLRLRDIDAVLEALYEAREELERRESSDVLHLLLCFLQHAREQKERKMAELRQQLACLEHDIVAVTATAAAVESPVGEGAAVAAAAAAAAMPEAGVPARGPENAAAAATGSDPGPSGPAGAWLRRALPHLHADVDVSGGGGAAAEAADTAAGSKLPPLSAAEPAPPPLPGPAEQEGEEQQRRRRRLAAHRAPPPRRSSWCLHTITPGGGISSVTVDTSGLLEPGQQAEAFGAAVQHALAAARGTTAPAASGSVSVGGAADDGVGGGGGEGRRSATAQPAREAADNDSLGQPPPPLTAADAVGPAGPCARGPATASAPAAEHQDSVSVEVAAVAAASGPVGSGAEPSASAGAAEDASGCEAGGLRRHAGGDGAAGPGANAAAAATGRRDGIPTCGSADNFRLFFGQVAAPAAVPAACSQPSASGEAAVSGGGEDGSAMSGAAFPPPGAAAAGGPRQLVGRALTQQEKQCAAAAAPAGDRGRQSLATVAAAVAAVGAPPPRPALAAGGDGARRPARGRADSAEESEDEMDVRERRRGRGRPRATGRPQPQPPSLPLQHQLHLQQQQQQQQQNGARVTGAVTDPRVVALASNGSGGGAGRSTRRAGGDGDGEGRGHACDDDAAAAAAVVATAADGDPAAVQAAKRRRMLSQFELLERCYLQMRAARTSGSGGSLPPHQPELQHPNAHPSSSPPPFSAAAAATAAASVATQQMQHHRQPQPNIFVGEHDAMFSLWDHSEAAAAAAQLGLSLGGPHGGGAAGAAADACGGAHPHRGPSGPGGRCNCDGGDHHPPLGPLGALGSGGAGDPDLETFGAVLAAATQYSRLELLAEIPRHGSGSGSGSVAAGGPGSGLQILSSIEFDLSDDLFATAGVVPRILVYDYQSLLRSRQQPQRPCPAPAPVVRPITELTARSKLSCLSYSRGVRQHLLAADYMGGVALWDTEAGMQVQDYEAHERRVWGVDFCPVPSNHHCFASGSDDGLVKVWSTRQPGSCLALELRGNVCSVQFHPTQPHLLAVGSALHCALVYDIRQPAAPLHTLLGHRRAVSYVRWLSNRHELVTASTDGTLKLWSLSPQPPPLTSAAADPAAVAAADLPAAGSAAPSAPPAPSLRGGFGGAELVRTFSGHVNERNFVGLCTEGDYIACGSESHEVVLYHRSLPQPALRYGFGPRMLELERGGAGAHPQQQQQPQQPSPQHFVTALQWRRNSPHLLAANSAGYVWLLGLRL